MNFTLQIKSKKWAFRCCPRKCKIRNWASTSRQKTYST